MEITSTLILRFVVLVAALVTVFIFIATMYEFVRLVFTLYVLIKYTKFGKEPSKAELKIAKIFFPSVFEEMEIEDLKSITRLRVIEGGKCQN